MDLGFLVPACGREALKHYTQQHGSHNRAAGTQCLYHLLATPATWCHVPQKPTGSCRSKPVMLCLVLFLPSHLVQFLPHTASLSTFTPEVWPCKREKHTPRVPSKECAHGAKTFLIYIRKSLKYIPGPGKSHTLAYLQLKIANNYHPHFVIFTNLLHKAFLMKEPL